tara:strand:+ start:79 stop:453 length:375 start_codon:yes stop_codon:yes gene_type:complete
MPKKSNRYAITTYEAKEYSEKDSINSGISYFLGGIENLEVNVNDSDLFINNETLAKNGLFNINLGFIHIQISGRDFEKLFRQMVLVKDKNNEALINCDHKHCYFEDDGKLKFKCVREEENNENS